MVITILAMNMMVVSSLVIEESTMIIDNDQWMIELPSKEENKKVTKPFDIINYSTKMLRSTRLISIKACHTDSEALLIAIVFLINVH